MAAVLSKESGLFALPVAAVTAWGWRRARDAPSARTMARRQMRLWVVCGASLVVALIARAVVLGATVAPAAIVAPGLDAHDAARAHRRDALALAADRRHARLADASLSPYYGPTIVPTERAVRAIVAVLVVLALVALAVAAARRGDRRPLVAVTWIALTYLPASNLITSVGLFLADRTLLGPTVGVALALAWAIDRASARARSRAARRVRRRDRARCVGQPALRGGVVEPSHAVGAPRRRRRRRSIAAISCSASTRASTATRRVRCRLLARAFAMEPRDRRVRFEYGQVLYTTARYADAVAVLAPLLRDGDVRREPTFVAMYLEAVGRSRGAEGVVAAGTPLLRSEAAAVAALYVGMADEQLGRFAAADSAYGVGLRAQPADTLLRARRAALESRAAPR